MRACVRACVRARARASVCVCGGGGGVGGVYVCVCVDRSIVQLDLSGLTRQMETSSEVVRVRALTLGC